MKLGKSAFTHPDDGVPDEVPAGLIEAILAARAGDTETGQS